MRYEINYSSIDKMLNLLKSISIDEKQILDIIEVEDYRNVIKHSLKFGFKMLS